MDLTTMQHEESSTHWKVFEKFDSIEWRRKDSDSDDEEGRLIEDFNSDDTNPTPEGLSTISRINSGERKLQ